MRAGRSPRRASKSVRLWKTHACWPSTTLVRVLRSPSSSTSIQSFLRDRAALRLLLPQLVVEHVDVRRDPLLVGLVGEVGAEGAAADVGRVGVDAAAALAEDARVARRQPGEVAAHHLGLVGGVRRTRRTRGERPGRLRARRNPTCPRDSPSTLGPCVWASSTSGPTPGTCWWSTPTAARRRCRRTPTRSRCASPSTSTTPEPCPSRGSTRSPTSPPQALAGRRGEGLRGHAGVRDLGGPRRRQLRRGARPRSRDRTGLPIEVLSGEDEARLTFLAVRRWLGWSAGRLCGLRHRRRLARDRRRRRRGARRRLVAAARRRPAGAAALRRRPARRRRRAPAAQADPGRDRPRRRPAAARTALPTTRPRRRRPSARWPGSAVPRRPATARWCARSLPLERAARVDPQAGGDDPRRARRDLPGRLAEPGATRSCRARWSPRP